MTGHARHAKGRRVVHFAAQPTLAFLAHNFGFAAEIGGLRASPLGRRDARAQSGARVESRVAHAERFVDILSRELVERRAAHASDHFAERDKPDVAIDETRARRRLQPLARQTLQSFVVTRPLLAEVEVRRVARAMRQELFNRDALPPAVFHLRQVTRHGIAQAHLPALDKNHDARRRRHNLR